MTIETGARSDERAIPEPFPELRAARAALYGRGKGKGYNAMTSFVNVSLKPLVGRVCKLNPTIPKLNSYQLYHFLIGSTVVGANVDLPGDLFRCYLQTESLNEQHAAGLKILEYYQSKKDLHT